MSCFANSKMNWGFSMRLFVAINFGEETVRQLASLRDELRGSSKSGSFTLTENLHLTLVFIGECSNKQATSVKSIMEEIHFEPFDITIDRIGRFKRDGGDIWWVGLEDSKLLFDLHRDLSDKLIAAGFDLDKRSYSPHITIGRKVSTSLKPHSIDPIREQISSIDLMKSERINGKLTYTSIFTRKN